MILESACQIRFFRCLASIRGRQCNGILVNAAHVCRVKMLENMEPFAGNATEIIDELKMC